MQLTDVGGRVIASDYRGPVAVIFFHFSNRVFEINKGCRFTQIIFQDIYLKYKYLKSTKDQLHSCTMKDISTNLISTRS